MATEVDIDAVPQLAAFTSDTAKVGHPAKIKFALIV